ncbi:MAG: hypothetical protein ACI35S_04015 [Anaeroplasma sp.]
MKCRLCNKDFYIKRTFLSLFSIKNEYICQKCNQKYPIKTDISNIFLGEYSLMVISMFDKKYKINYDVFYKEYSKLFLTCLKNKNYKTLFVDDVHLNDYFIEHMEKISRLFNSNIIIFCFNVRN